MEGQEEFEKNFSCITVSFKHCIDDGKSEEDCASSDEIKTTIKEINGSFFTTYTFK